MVDWPYLIGSGLGLGLRLVVFASYIAVTLDHGVEKVVSHMPSMASSVCRDVAFLPFIYFAGGAPGRAAAVLRALRVPGLAEGVSTLAGVVGFALPVRGCSGNRPRVVHRLHSSESGG